MSVRGIDRWFLSGLLLLLIVAAALSLWKFNHFQVGTYMDDAQYIVLAESIVEGEDYGLIYPPQQILSTRFPVGWPLILSPFYKLFDGNIQSLKAASFLFTLANTLLIVVGWRLLGFLKRSVALLVAALYAVSPLVVGHAGMVMSEPAFLFFVLLGIMLAVRLSLSTRGSAYIALLLGVTWVFSTYVRTIGLTLVLATMFYLIWKRKWSTIVLASISSGLTLLIIISFTTIDGHDLINIVEYASQFEDPSSWGQKDVAIEVLPRIGQGIIIYFDSILRDTLIPFIGDPTSQTILNRVSLGFLPMLTSVFVFLLVSIGYAASVKRNWNHPVHLYVLAYIAVTIVWPWRGERFLYGVLPFLFGYLIGGVRVILDAVARQSRLKMQWAADLGWFLLLLLLLAQIVRTAIIDDSLNHVPDLEVGTRWIRENTLMEAIVAAEQPAITHLFTQRSTIPLPHDTDAIQELVDQDVIYLLIAPELQWGDGQIALSERSESLLADIRISDTHFSLVFEDPKAKVRIYRVGEN
jgi:hypothetical protein